MDLKIFLHNLPQKPGVYSMQDCDNRVIYVGKAKNLKNRIKSYFQSKTIKNTNLKRAALIAGIKNIEITITKNEIEALLLENKLINQLKPKYNVIFRDDKSYPYILLTNEEYPSLVYSRGKSRKKNGTIYGPYPNINAVKTSLDLLYKIFKLRSCDTVFFKNRTRPCLEYQLQRCTAPCVGLINPEQYAKDVENVKLFLQSKSKLLIKNLTKEMQDASIDLDYELAAKLRDQIKALSLLQNEQAVINKKAIDVDVIGIASSPKLICIHLLRIRQGDVLYSRQFFSKNTILTINNNDEEFLEEFILQNYFTDPTTNKHQNSSQDPTKISSILTTINLKNATAISKVINIKLFCAKNGDKLAWQKIAQTSADEALSTRVVEYRRQKNNFKILTNLIGRVKLIERIACFDVSHTAGKETVAACVVFNVFGKEQSSYRLFNIKTSNPSDDYLALEQAMVRYMRQIMIKSNLAPDLVIVDGGKGQLAVAEKVIDNFKLQINANNLIINLLGIAKGKDRKPGLEKIYLTSDGLELSLQSTSQVFMLLQRIRDAAHRFAITSHRKNRDKLIKK